MELAKRIVFSLSKQLFLQKFCNFQSFPVCPELDLAAFPRVEDPCAALFKAFRDRRVRMPVAVIFSAGDHGKGGLKSLQKGFGRGIFRAVVSDLQNVDRVRSKARKAACCRLFPDKPQALLFAFLFQVSRQNGAESAVGEQQCQRRFIQVS